MLICIIQMTSFCNFHDFKNYALAYIKTFFCSDCHCVCDLSGENYTLELSGCIRVLVHKFWYPESWPSLIILMST